VYVLDQVHKWFGAVPVQYDKQFAQSITIYCVFHEEKKLCSICEKNLPIFTLITSTQISKYHSPAWIFDQESPKILLSLSVNQHNCRYTKLDLYGMIYRRSN